ncbi:MAG: hypothetical protein LBE76_09445 [Nitrososphaerota archaeon]|nr:hypothetical protein [Nitrososphaerota archaeon]
MEENRETHHLKRIFIVSLFGSITFVVNIFLLSLPPPINYMFIAPLAVLLALSGLFIKKIGSTYAGAIGGLLTALGSPGLGLLTFIASILFGALIDTSLYVFRVKKSPLEISRNRLIVAIAVSTMIIGITTYTASTTFPEYINLPNMMFFIERSFLLDIMVMFMGPATGATAGYASAYLWNKHLKSIAQII